MKYSVIIPSYNSETTIAACLRSVTEQQFDEPYEIIVVDSSDDGTPEIIRTQFPQIILIHLAERTVPGTARNIGIERSQGEIVCFIDSDCIANPDWLSRIAEVHKEDYTAVGGSIANGNPESLIGWAGYFAEFREFFPFHPKQFMSNIPTCNISYKRGVFERYRVFSHNFYPQEDFVFNLQLYKNKDSILFDPAVKVAHINKTSLKHFFIHQHRIGCITSIVLKHFPFLPGGVIASSKILTIFAAPFLPGVKFVNTFRVALLSRKYKRFFVLVSPLLFTGLLFWMVGFVRGSFFPNKLLE